MKTRREFLKSLAAIALGATGFAMISPRPRSDWKTHTITAFVPMALAKETLLMELYSSIGCLNSHEFCGKPPQTVSFRGANATNLGNVLKLQLRFEHRKSFDFQFGDKTFAVYNTVDFRGLERLES